VRVRLHEAGLLTLIGAQIDSVTVDALPKPLEFDVAMRIVGSVADFQEPHEFQAELTAPDTETIGHLTRAIEPREPAPTALPGYETTTSSRFGSPSRLTRLAATICAYGRTASSSRSPTASPSRSSRPERGPRLR
jgi:hypothetical protein